MSHDPFGSGDRYWSNVALDWVDRPRHDPEALCSPVLASHRRGHGSGDSTFVASLGRTRRPVDGEWYSASDSLCVEIDPDFEAWLECDAPDHDNAYRNPVGGRRRAWSQERRERHGRELAEYSEESGNNG